MSAEDEIKKELASGRLGARPLLAEAHLIPTGDPTADRLAALEGRVEAIDRTLKLVGRMIDDLKRP